MKDCLVSTDVSLGGCNSLCSLARADILEQESLLISRLRHFLSFSGHALYFPTSALPEEPEYLPRERKLLLPLRYGGVALGMLMLHGVRAREVRPLFPLLASLAQLCLELLQRVKLCCRDRVTGLATEDVLYGLMEAEAARVRAQLSRPCTEEENVPLHRLCMGLVLVRVDNGRAVASESGFCFSDALMAQAAQAFAREVPPEACAARVGRFGIAALLPAVSGRGVCRQLAEAALARLSGVCLPEPLSGRAVRPVVSVGYAVYPQDMEGGDFALDMSEQARRLMERARLAARVASRRGGAGAVMSFARILQEGGSVVQVLPLGRVRISLGKRAKAREGLRFSVWEGGPQGRYKGEIVLLQVTEQDAVAETLHLADAAAPLCEGDALALLSEESGAPRQDAENGGGGNEGEEDARGICSHGMFLRRFALERERDERFALTILRREPDGSDEDPLTPLIDAWKAAPALCGERVLAGRYGGNALIFYHPGVEAEALAPHWAELCTALAARGVTVVAGIAGHPFLQFRKTEAPECALKALEYAQLLPAPHVGVCNSLALNISADKRYSLGDVFGAIEEYKLALLADQENVLAWNSLGTCYAALGRHNEARRYFLEALQRSPGVEQAVQTRYNLGTVCLQLEDRKAAAEYFRQCIADAPDHLYAHLRLGQLCEDAGRRAEAQKYYEQAAAIEEERERRDGEVSNVARRCLARLVARQRKGEEAREMLHDALLRNPRDDATMRMLASLYLDGGDDPAVAETLARRSLLQHECAEGWRLLSRALAAQGKSREADEAAARAAVL
ncbi:MAG: tetratricopeptide repeat protein [Desulfovibrio sp.]|uniref:tetratricopeptide repeat protein n=1 Tax=Desulfovibrio sp. TaxID=885 RepID=UPI0025C472D5|nr:tetratricopeptide repeat protein [Desulfovibrio sp.]MCI7568631.1 tetratricopeptide repeat protein [Desulfovibrio sp.]